MKYFLLGAFATGFLLYGIALIYGATGFFRLDQIAAAIPDTKNHTMLITGVAMLIVAFGFKVAAVPFHMWTPDVYEGAPTTVTAFMAVAVKAAGFAAFVRIFLHGLRRSARRLVGAALGDRRAHDDRRQRAGARPEEREAHARVLEHRARRLHPGGARRLGRGRRHRRALLPPRLLVHDPRRVRGRRRDRRGAASPTRPSTTMPASGSAARSSASP